MPASATATTRNATVNEASAKSVPRTRSEFGRSAFPTASGWSARPRLRCSIPSLTIYAAASVQLMVIAAVQSE